MTNSVKKVLIPAPNAAPPAPAKPKARASQTPQAPPAPSKGKSSYVADSLFWYPILARKLRAAKSASERLVAVSQHKGLLQALK